MGNYRKVTRIKSIKRKKYFLYGSLLTHDIGDYMTRSCRECGELTTAWTGICSNCANTNRLIEENRKIEFLKEAEKIAAEKGISKELFYKTLDKIGREQEAKESEKFWKEWEDEKKNYRRLHPNRTEIAKLLKTEPEQVGLILGTIGGLGLFTWFLFWLWTPLGKGWLLIIVVSFIIALFKEELK